MKNNGFYNGRKVFITGHTGFKGSWICKILLEEGAQICGYSLEPDSENILFSTSKICNEVHNVFGDIRDYGRLSGALSSFMPDVVIHMAAQPIVRESYKNPLKTYSTNVIGTVNILEAIRNCESVRSVVNVTTDKVYKNIEQQKGYVEEDALNGFDPYSNSKSCSELVTSAYINSYFDKEGVAVSTCRAGNVIGGGDFSKDRIVPDCYRFASENKKIIVRNPDSVRPYQHVIDPVAAYLLVAHKQYEDTSTAGAFNIGPDFMDNIKTKDIVTLFCSNWGEGVSWKVQKEAKAPHEAKYLYLDCKKIKKELDWHPIWDIGTAIQKTVEWYKHYFFQNDICRCMENQIRCFYRDGGRI